MQRKDRSDRKRTDRAASATSIKEAALTLFVRKGYHETTTDEIAARAGVSKQTIYRNFRDKESLFRTLIRDSVERATSFLRNMSLTLDTECDLAQALRDVALDYIDTVFQPQVLELRHLIVAEARHFPELATYYYREVPQRTLDTLAMEFERLAGQGLTRACDPHRKARHFAALLMMLPLDKAMFGIQTSRDDLERQAIEGVEAFLASYETQGPSREPE